MDLEQVFSWTPLDTRGVVMAVVAFVLSASVAWWAARKERRRQPSKLDELVSVTITSTGREPKARFVAAPWTTKWPEGANEQQLLDKAVADAVAAPVTVPCVDSGVGLVRDLYEQSGAFVPGSVEAKEEGGMVVVTGTLWGPSPEDLAPWSIVERPECAVTLTQEDRVLRCYKEPGHVERGDHWHRDQRIEWDDGEMDGAVPLVLCEVIVGSEPDDALSLTAEPLSVEWGAGDRAALEKAGRHIAAEVERQRLDPAALARHGVMTREEAERRMLKEALFASGAVVPGSMDVSVAPPQSEAEKSGRVLRATMHYTPPSIDEEKLAAFAKKYGAMPSFTVLEARRLYAAFRAEAGKLDGAPPAWERLDVVTRGAWIAVARAAMERT